MTRPRSAGAVAAYDRAADMLIAEAREVAGDLVGPGQERALATLSTCYPHIRQTFRQLVDRRPDAALDLCSLLARSWEMNALWFEGSDMMQAALDAHPPDAASSLRANVEAWLGVFRYRLGDFPAAHALLASALAALRELGDAKGMADTLNDLGLLFDAEGRYDEAFASYEESAAIHQTLGDDRALAVSYTNLGNTAGNMGRADLAREFFHKSLDLAERVGDLHALANTFNNLGALEEAETNYADARAWHEKSLELRERLRDMDGIATSHHNLAYLDIGEGRFDQAHAHLASSVELYRRVGNRAHLSRAIGTLGFLRMALNDPAGSVVLYALSQRLDQEIGVVLYPDVRSTIDGHLADARARLGAASYDEAWNRGQRSTVDEALQAAGISPIA